MGKFLALVLALVACCGCSSLPEKNSTVLAGYTKLVVRDINWRETAVSDVPDEQMKAFVTAQPALNALFRAEFDRYIHETALFQTVAYGDAPADAQTLILLPKFYTLKPGGFMPGASYVGLLLTADGKLVGRYAEERRLNSSNAGPDELQGNIEKLVRELAEDAASKLPTAR